MRRRTDDKRPLTLRLCAEPSGSIEPALPSRTPGRHEQAPRIEAIPRRASTDRPGAVRLLLELLALELELRQEQGRGPVDREYHERFPDHAGIVAQAFRDLSGLAATGSHPAGPKRAPAHRADRTGPRRFGDYELLGELARGGMGVVYRARQVSLDRVVALKMILSGQFASEAEIRRFRAEAEAAAHLDHPHIVPIFEVGRHQGHAFFSMKLIAGGNLGRHLARYLDDPEATARLMATVARTIEHAHRKGMIHRDLKPSNILIDESGQPLIADFGLVKRAGDGSSLTSSGVLLGTPAYMAPEQVSGDEAAPAADIYSLGAILYQLLTGRPPFRGGTVAETLAQVLEHDPVPPRKLRPSIPRELEYICLKCLEKSPGKRYHSAAALAADLERFLRGEEVHVGQVSLASRLCPVGPGRARVRLPAGGAGPDPGPHPGQLPDQSQPGHPDPSRQDRGRVALGLVLRVAPPAGASRAPLGARPDGLDRAGRGHADDPLADPGRGRQLADHRLSRC